MIVLENGDYVFVNNIENATFTRQYRIPIASPKTSSLSFSYDDIVAFDNFIVRHLNEDGKVCTESKGSPQAGGLLYLSPDQNLAAIVYGDEILSILNKQAGDFVVSIKGTLTAEFLQQFSPKELLPKFSFHSFIGHAMGICATGGSTPLGSGSVYSYPGYKYDPIGTGDCVVLYKGEIIGVVGPSTNKNYGIPVPSTLDSASAEWYLTLGAALKGSNSILVNKADSDSSDTVWLAADQPSAKSVMEQARLFMAEGPEGYLRQKPLSSAIKYIGQVSSAIFPNSLASEDKDKVTHVVVSEDTLGDLLFTGLIKDITTDYDLADLLILDDDFAEIIAQYNSKYLEYAAELMKVTFEQISQILTSCRNNLVNSFRSRVYDYITTEQRRLLERNWGIDAIDLRFNPQGKMKFTEDSMALLADPVYTGDDVTDAATLIAKLQWVVDPRIEDMEEAFVSPATGIFLALTNTPTKLKECIYTDVDYCPFCIVANDTLISPSEGAIELPQGWQDDGYSWAGFTVKEDGLYDPTTNVMISHFEKFSYAFNAFREDLVGDIVTAWCEKNIFSEGSSQGLKYEIDKFDTIAPSIGASYALRKSTWKRWWSTHDTYKSYSGKTSVSNFKRKTLVIREVGGYLVPEIHGIWNETLKYCQRGANYDNAVSAVLDCVRQGITSDIATFAKVSRCSDTSIWDHIGDFMGGKVVTVLTLGLGATWNKVRTVPFTISFSKIKFDNISIPNPVGAISTELATKMCSAVRSGAGIAAYSFVRPKLDAIRLSASKQTAIGKITANGATVAIEDLKKISTVDDGYLAGLKALVDVLDASTRETATVKSALVAFYNGLLYLIKSSTVPIYVVEQGDLTSGGAPQESKYAFGLTLKIKGEV